MVRKRFKLISEESNHYNTLQEAMDDFTKFKTAQGMAELTMQDYSRTFKEWQGIRQFNKPGYLEAGIIDLLDSSFKRFIRKIQQAL